MNAIADRMKRNLQQLSHLRVSPLKAVNENNSRAMIGIQLGEGSLQTWLDTMSIIRLWLGRIGPSPCHIPPPAQIPARSTLANPIQQTNRIRGISDLGPMAPGPRHRLGRHFKTNVNAVPSDEHSPKPIFDPHEVKRRAQRNYLGHHTGKTPDNRNRLTELPTLPGHSTAR